MRALRKMTVVELKLFLRDPITLVFTLILPFLTLLVMGEVFGRQGGISEMYRNVNPMDYYAPAYIGVVMAAVGLVAIPVHIASYRERGILRRLRASSLSTQSLVSSQLAVGALITLVSVAILMVPSVLIYHIQAPVSLPLVLASSALALVTCCALGAFLGFVLPSARAAQGVGMPLWFFMFVLSGGGPPRDVMTPAMKVVGKMLPQWHITSLVQDAWLGYGWNVVASLVLVGVLIVATGVTLLVFRRE